MPSLTASRGLITSPNELARPDGALEIADNVVIDYDNTIEQRRGFAEFGDATPDDEQIKQLLVYKGRILRHYADKLAFDSTGSGSFVEFNGSYMELATKLRIKYLESNGNLYFTTTEGIKKISALSASDFTSNAGYITNAGGVKAVGLEGKIKPEASGWLPAQSKVGYRIAWGIKDANNNVIRGVPSSRLVITNSSSDVNIGERFTVTVLNHAGISDSDYFTFDTPSNKFALWFDKTGSATAPVAAELLNRSLYKVDIKNLTLDNDVAAQIAAVLSTISDISVEISTNEVTVSNVDGGDVLDASNGTLDPADVIVSTIYNGQTAVGTPANVQLTFTVPYGVDSDLYFYEVYRTAVTTVTTGVTLSDLDPGDECQKVYESGVTQAEITAGSVVVDDITPDTFREGGAYLYTNPVTGEGILQANEAPPIAKDIALFKGSVFYANTKERHRNQINLLSVSDFISGSSKIHIGNSNGVRTYTFRGIAEVLDFTVKPKSETVGNSYAIINSAQDRIKYKIWFDKGEIYHTFNSTTDVDDATETITVVNHGFADGDSVIAGGVLPTGLTSGNTYYVINRTANTFQLSSMVGGLAIDLTDVVGNGTLTHLPIEPVVADTISLRVALETYPDTLQGSADAFVDAFFDISDFSPEDQGSGLVRVFNTDNGASTDPSESTPASSWTISVNTQGAGEDAGLGYVLLSGLSSVGQSVEDTARSLERVINKDPNSSVNAFYLSGPTDLPGILLLVARSLSDKWNPSLPLSATITDIQIVGNLFTTSSAHNFSTGDKVYINDNPNGTSVEFSGVYTVATTPSATEFTLASITVTINQSAISGLVFETTVASDNSANQNRVYFSKPYQPEAVPLVNYIDIGPKDKAIQRILALRDSLIVLKEEGVYLISGPSAPDFSVRLVDSSALTLAPDTAVNLNNLIYVLTTQGVVTVSETGVGVLSRNIENKIQEIANSKYDYKLTSWGVASESDRCYIIWLPSKPSDTVATQAFRYNTFTRAWTRWTKPANCGLVNLEDDKIYLGDASGRYYVLRERKNLERQDYADRDFTLQLPTEFVNGTTYDISSAIEIEAGDVLVQEQYVDINKFNRMLKKLDREVALSGTYLSELEMVIGDNMEVSILALWNKLTSDGITLSPLSGGNTAVQLQTDFNSIVSVLNDPLSITGAKDYKTADDLLVYETLILDVNIPANQVTVKFSTNFLVGNVQVFKAIKSKVQYVPQHFGKPETTKQISEGTFIFDQTNFWGGTVGYSTDRSYDFSSISFTEKGPGNWAGFDWGSAVWGGGGNEVPVRVFVPREKTRCRYIHIQFMHSNAREKWRLLGVSLEPREVSPRGYR
jgi:hypothetical protein